MNYFIVSLLVCFSRGGNSLRERQFDIDRLSFNQEIHSNLLKQTQKQQEEEAEEILITSLKKSLQKKQQ